VNIENGAVGRARNRDDPYRIIIVPGAASPLAVNGVMPHDWPLDAWMWGGLSAYSEIELSKHHYRTMIFVWPVVILWYSLIFVPISEIDILAWCQLLFHTFVLPAAYVLAVRHTWAVFNTGMREALSKAATRFEEHGYDLEYKEITTGCCAVRNSHYEITLQPIADDQRRATMQHTFSNEKEANAPRSTSLLSGETKVPAYPGYFETHQDMLPGAIDIWAWGTLVESLRTGLRESGNATPEMRRFKWLAFLAQMVPFVIVGIAIFYLIASKDGSGIISDWRYLVFFACCVIMVQSYKYIMTSCVLRKLGPGVAAVIHRFSPALEERTGVAVEYVVEPVFCLFSRGSFRFTTKESTPSHSNAAASSGGIVV